MELKGGPANLQRGAESVGGKLALDGRRLRFQPHRANAQRDQEVIEITDIKRIDRAWTKLLGVVPIAPNGMDVVMRNGETFRFTVSGRKDWIQTIEHARADTPRGG